MFTAVRVGASAVWVLSSQHAHGENLGCIDVYLLREIECWFECHGHHETTDFFVVLGSATSTPPSHNRRTCRSWPFPKLCLWWQAVSKNIAVSPCFFYVSLPGKAYLPWYYNRLNVLKGGNSSFIMNLSTFTLIAAPRKEAIFNIYILQVPGTPSGRDWKTLEEIKCRCRFPTILKIASTEKCVQVLHTPPQHPPHNHILTQT